MNDWQKKMRIMRLENIKANWPAAFLASGGYDMIVPAYSDATANKLTRAIIDYLVFSGHHASRISVQGQARVQKVPRYSLLTGKVETTDKISWTKGSTRRGFADIVGVVHGRFISIEIKVGRDTIKKDQTDERERVIKAGGLYLVATSFPQFHDWYQKQFSNSKTHI